MKKGDLQKNTKVVLFVWNTSFSKILPTNSTTGLVFRSSGMSSLFRKVVALPSKQDCTNEMISAFVICKITFFTQRTTTLDEIIVPSAVLVNFYFKPHK